MIGSVNPAELQADPLPAAPVPTVDRTDTLVPRGPSKREAFGAIGTIPVETRREKADRHG